MHSKELKIMQIGELTDNFTDELALIKMAMYMRVVKIKRQNEIDFNNDPTAVRAYENLKKQLPELLFYLSIEQMKIVIERYKSDLEYFKNNP